MPAIVENFFDICDIRNMDAVVQSQTQEENIAALKETLEQARTLLWDEVAMATCGLAVRCVTDDALSKSEKYQESVLEMLRPLMNDRSAWILQEKANVKACFGELALSYDK